MVEYSIGYGLQSHILRTMTTNKPIVSIVLRGGPFNGDTITRDLIFTILHLVITIDCPDEKYGKSAYTLIEKYNENKELYHADYLGDDFFDFLNI